MNLKTVERVIRRGKGSYLFGRRSFVRVSIPIASLGSAPPPRPNLGKPGSFQGYWSSKSGKLTVMTAIHEVTSGSDPRLRRKDKNAPEALFVEKKTWREGCEYTWWEGERRYFRGKASRETLVKVEPLPCEDVEAYKNYRDWMDKYGGHEETGIEPFDAFVEAGIHARGINSGLRGNQLILQFAVKYFYPETRKAFAKALTAAMRLSEKVGFGAKLLGAEPATKVG